MTKWTASDIPSQKGRIAIVTGTGGLGYEDALALARAGAEVIVAGRNPDKGADAVARILAAVPGGRVRFEGLDLASMASVKAFSDRFAARHDQLDLLINNAGVMVPPRRQQTADGFELQIGTNQYCGGAGRHGLQHRRAKRRDRLWQPERGGTLSAHGGL
jgi:NAD(P)-dependent dehydrogenase (short-subunit alcohol dehydrogenase family)